MTRVMEDEHPVSLQIFGHDIDTHGLCRQTARSAQRLRHHRHQYGMSGQQGHQGAGGQRAHAGAWPMRRQLVEADRRRPVKKPVTVKIRAGFDSAHINAVEYGPAHGSSRGQAALCVHGRTRAQMYEGKADWDDHPAGQAGREASRSSATAMCAASPTCRRMMEETGVRCRRHRPRRARRSLAHRDSARTMLETGEQLPPVPRRRNASRSPENTHSA